MILEKLTLSILVTAEQAGHAADTVTHAAGHGESSAPELPNFIQMLAESFHGAFSNIYQWENIAFAFLAAIIMCVVALRVYAKRQMMPNKLQNLVEMIVEALDNFFHSILGHHARRYTPFLGTLFIYILIMNWMGLIPFLKAPTSSATITVSLALIVFVRVQFAGFRYLGVGGWFYHMLGQPSSAVTWALSPLFFVIHFFGEIIKPVSLSMRLFGNITGEDMLIAAFASIGVLALSFLHLPAGIPFQWPFYFLGLMLSAIQALVFTALSTVYFSMMLPHEEHGEEHK